MPATKTLEEHDLAELAARGARALAVHAGAISIDPATLVDLVHAARAAERDTRDDADVCPACAHPRGEHFRRTLCLESFRSRRVPL